MTASHALSQLSYSPRRDRRILAFEPGSVKKRAGVALVVDAVSRGALVYAAVVAQQGAAAVSDIERKRMGPGGPSGLQNRVSGGFAVRGGFDSHALPPRGRP